MANEAKRTEHSGAKKGKGAYWGKKDAAKHESNRKRREDDKVACEVDLESKEFDPFLINEALDRSNLILDQLERALGESSVIQNDKEAKDLYDKAVENLADLYQLLGQKSFASR